MNKDQAYHVCRAAAAIANVDSVFVYGSNAIIFWLDEVGLKDTREILEDHASRKLDLSVSEEDEKLNLIVDGAIGEMSMFDSTFGVYAHANSPQKLFKAPKSWASRLKTEKEPVSGITIVVPHPLDLVFSKMIAFREKDLVFCERVLKVFNLKIEELEKIANEYVKENPEEKEVVVKALAIVKNRIRSTKNKGTLRKNSKNKLHP